MRIKSLHVSGFKSFCHKVEIDFQQNGVTVIVGPNGCGKSNVVDAIRWVLGEQRAKHLRGGAMEDVIFAGSAFQKPLGMAEVTLTFSNLDGDVLTKYMDYTEIAVTRRLYRSGESIYMINKTPVRLMDIRELFMDTGVGGGGYSIIEQGKVGEIISAKPSERRLLIEDAAGIVKFQSKRQQAEKRMEETLLNLSRVDDILRELHIQEETLRDQVVKAQAYIQVRDELQQTDQNLSTFRWNKAIRKEQESEQTILKYKELQFALQNEKATLETNIERVSLQEAMVEKELEILREELFQREREIQDLDNKRALEKQNIANFQNWIDRHDEELTELREKIVNLLQHRSETDNHLEQLKQQHKEVQAFIQNIEQERSEEEIKLTELNTEMQQMQRQLITVHTELTNNTNQRSFMQDRLDNFLDRHLKMNDQLRSSDQLILQSERKVEQAQTKVELVQNDKETQEEHLLKLQSDYDSQEEAVELTQSRLKKTQYDFHAASSQLESLKNIQTRHEDFGDNVKKLFDLLEKNPDLRQRLGIMGILADFIHIPAQYVELIGPVMVDYLDWVIVKQANALPDVEAFCQQKGLGRLNYIALDKLDFDSPPATDGQPMSSFIEFRGAVAHWGQRFFGLIRVLDDSGKTNLDHLNRSVSIQNTAEWLTANGTYVLRNGSVRIGKTQSTTFGFLERQKKIDELQEQTETLEEQVEELEGDLQELTEQQEQLEEAIQETHARTHELELELLRNNKELEHDVLEFKRARQAHELLQSDLSLIEKEKEKVTASLQSVCEALVALEDKRSELEDRLTRQQESILLQKRMVDQVSENLLGQRVALTEAFEQLKNAQKTVDRLHQEHREAEVRLVMLNNAHEDSRKKVEHSQKIVFEIDAKFEHLLKDREAAKAQQEETALKHQDVSQERTEKNAALHKARQDLELLMGQIHEEDLKTTEFRFQREQLEQQLLTSYNMTPDELSQNLDLSGLNENELAGQLRSLRAKMGAMDQVNLAAPDEYALLTERMGFLTRQSDDLKHAVDDLQKTIREINNESRRRFRETFDMVNMHFKETFTTLFGGGDAKMVLTEAEDILEAGIEIVAQPPGKRLQNLNLFSGGEKALTAISLIFGIFLIKPSPFCLLDEVDAPLDDTNVGRFNHMIRKLTDNSQFIVITHNKKTMAIGERLYGVTMEEPGVSKTVSVQFNEAESLTA
ncbi:MAG: chromosome segregation protein SMC [SAR324 cluster bacterium]|nr:chromosome segregation protein SMC [SAR324 cluster bacterium]